MNVTSTFSHDGKPRRLNTTLRPAMGCSGDMSSVTPSPKSNTVVFLGMGKVGAGVTVGVTAGTGVAVGVAVGSGVAADVAVGSGVAADVAVRAGVAVGVAVGTGVAADVAVRAGVAVGVAVGTGVAVGIAIGPGDGVAVGTGEAVGAGVAVAVDFCADEAVAGVVVAGVSSRMAASDCGFGTSRVAINSAVG